MTNFKPILLCVWCSVKTQERGPRDETNSEYLNYFLPVILYPMHSACMTCVCVVCVCVLVYAFVFVCCVFYAGVGELGVIHSKPLLDRCTQHAQVLTALAKCK